MKERGESFWLAPLSFGTSRKETSKNWQGCLRQGRIGIRREQHTSPGDSLAHIDPSFFSTARHSGYAGCNSDFVMRLCQCRKHALHSGNATARSLIR
ncbi:hypothetical protein EAG_11342 [Camponotus floridanus]|uniref:Uncharacterized protein n=1 Tax=Camponotus floridanus TaxID=104421 RepID=E2A0Z6_CAMFO|nr:hypothetical protein EAG_11342 [Camponotus floridanus]